jgi:hypothetical protein
MTARASQRIDRIETELAALQQTVDLLVAGDADPLLTVQAAAVLAGRDPETVRLWCTRRKLGFHDLELKRHRIPRSELIAFLVETFGAENLPFPLRALFGSNQITAAYPPGHGTRKATSPTAGADRPQARGRRRARRRF